MKAAGYDILFGVGFWQYKQGGFKGYKVNDTAFDIHPVKRVVAIFMTTVYLSPKVPRRLIFH